MNATTPRAGSVAGSIVCRGLVPLWLATGAAIKLAERSPMLMPSPVRDGLKAVAGALGRGSEAEFAAFLDQALRVIVAGEFILAAAMIALPALSRRIAIPVLSLFVVILLMVVARGEASCGCFGSKGPSPAVVLAGDALLLALAVGLRPLAPQMTRNHLTLVAKLKAMGAIEQIKVVGHADPTGKSAANQKLSEARAKSVKSYLVAKGVKPGVIMSSGVGDSQTVVQCDKALARDKLKECHAPNRRVEIEIVAKAK